MFSGKTDYLIGRAESALSGNPARIGAFRPRIDTRDEEAALKSRTGRAWPAMRIQHAAQMLEIQDDYDLFLVEEAQMLPGVLDVALMLRRKGKEIVLAALTLLWNGSPWDGIPELLCHADQITVAREAYCDVCGATAVYTARKKHFEEDLVPGNGEIYSPRCPLHFDTPTE